MGEDVVAIKTEEEVLAERESIRAFTLLLIQKLVDFPEKVEVRIIQGEQTTVYEVKCEKEDLGKIIGKQGRTVSAVREILRVMCGKNKLRGILDVQE